MHFDVIILGCGAATPTLQHAPTSQAVCWQGRWILLDAGEGVQTNIRKYKVPMQKIDTICISHMHGDHVLGLPGLLGSMNLFGRERDLTLVGPASLETYVRESLRLTHTFVRFTMHFIACDTSRPAQIQQWGDNCLESIPVKHRIEAFGFKLQNVPTKRNLKKASVPALNLQRSEILKLKSGKDVVRATGERLIAEKLCLPLPNTSTYVFSGDTAPCENIRVASQGANVLYHESTFLHELKSTARSTGHSTAQDAATLAAEAGVHTLVLGHLSSRYQDESRVEEEGRRFFGNTHLATEGMRIRLSPKEMPRIDYLE